MNLWPFRKRISLQDSGIFSGFTDWHSHILPGVDDGMRTMGESLEILRLYEKMGVRSVWLTPHIMEDIPNTTAHLRERFAELQASYSGSVELHLAAENMLDGLFEERLEKNDLLPLGENGDHLLVETSYFNPPMDLFGTLERIKVKGYYPVLAHPERYGYMEKEEYQMLKKFGIEFQLNLFSLVGIYGKSIQRKAEWLLKNSMIAYWGSDVHHMEAFYNLIINRSFRHSVKYIEILNTVLTPLLNEKL